MSETPSSPNQPNHHEASQRRKKLLLTTLRWSIAVVGIAWVASKISLHDRAELLDTHNHPQEVILTQAPPDNFESVTVAKPPQFAGEHTRSELVNKPDAKQLTLTDGKVVRFLASELIDDPTTPNLKIAKRLLVADNEKSDGRWIDPSEIKGGYTVHTPYPLINAGINGMVVKANPAFLWAALLVFPLTYVITSFRFYTLLKVLEINMPLGRAFVLNMVGSFYNTFMPGSTGGDLLKAYYTSKLTPHRTRAVMSVLVDRVIGLLALILLGGIAASFQWHIHACRNVALASFAMLGGTALGLAVFYTPVLRRWTGLDFIIKRLPMQRQVHLAIEAMELYRRRPLTVLGTIFMSLPVHGTVVTSAMFAGLAFGILKDNPAYYWVAVPVIVLSGSIPISPQGVGVMEGFAVLLLQRQSGTIAQAFALTMSIRVVGILWNLTGGLFVLRGGFHAPTDQEQHTMDTDADEPPAPAVPA